MRRTVSDENPVQLSTRVPQRLLHDAKVHACQQEQTLNQFVLEALREHLAAGQAHDN